MPGALHGAAAGAIGGFAGTFAMNYAQRLWTSTVGRKAPESAAGKHDSRDWQERHEHRNANEVVAHRLALAMLRRPLKRSELAAAAVAVHFGFGTTVGALYGACAQGRSALASGVGLGFAVWLLADELAMPAIGASESTRKRPLEMHMQSLFAHLVYGALTEQLRRVMAADSGSRLTPA